MSLRWTKTAPSAPGWYWVRFNPVSAPEAVQVVQTDRGLRVGPDEDSAGLRLSEFAAWAGPLTPPPDGPAVLLVNPEVDRP